VTGSVTMDLAEIDLVSPETFAGGPPHPLFARLRREAPVFLHGRLDRPPFWLLSRYRDIVDVSRDWSCFSSASHGAFLDELPEARRDRTRSMVDLDPPEHTRLRQILSRFLTPQRIQLLARRVQARCSAVLARVSPRGECDFASDIAAELSLAVLFDLLGIPGEDDRRHLRRLSTILADPQEQMLPDAADRAASEMLAYANELARWRGKAPGSDLVSSLLEDSARGEGLTESEFERLFLLLATAGHLTSAALMSGAMLALFEHPGQWRDLVGDPSLLATGVDEMLRWVSPVMQFQRTATRDTVVGGQPIRAGDRLALYYVSANRDEAVFHDPGRLDLARAPNPHVSFGAGGPHFCPGHHLARLEVQTLFEELTRRMPDIAPAAPPDYLSSPFINGIRSLPVRFSRGRPGGCIS
jgi:cholest-4-en-3-one 26-monooxygenase